MGREDNLTSYELSDAWRCPKAPVNPEFPLQVRFNIGAHHWVGKWFGDKVGYAFMCIHCFDVRKFPLTFVDTFKPKKGKPSKVNLEDVEDGKNLQDYLG